MNGFTNFVNHSNKQSQRGGETGGRGQEEGRRGGKERKSSEKEEESWIWLVRESPLVKRESDLCSPAWLHDQPPPVPVPWAALSRTHQPGQKGGEGKLNCKMSNRVPGSRCSDGNKPSLPRLREGTKGSRTQSPLWRKQRPPPPHQTGCLSWNLPPAPHPHPSPAPGPFQTF